MAKVEIDIPGIGLVEAQNAASETTLKEIAKLLGAKSGTGSGGGAADKIMGPSSPLGKSSKGAGGMFTKLGNFAKMAGGKIAAIGGPAVAVAKAFIEVGTAASKIMGNMANLDKSVKGAASSIPIVGAFYGPVVEASEKMVDAFQSASGSGASFGGRLQNLTNAAANAGMTVNEYTKFVRDSGEAFRLLGGNVEAGRKRFESLSKEMRTSGMMTQLNALGYTSTEVNEGMSRYTKILGQTGRLQGMSTQQLAQRSANYMKEIDKLAKATGQERAQIEENQAKLLRDAQFQAKVANMGVTQADALRATITGLPQGLQGVAKDIIATGTATTKESQEFAALMPKSAAMMQEFARITDNGGTITNAMQQELQNTMSAEGKVRKQQYRDQGRYNADIADTYMRVIDAANIQTDALTTSADAQDKQIKLTDGAAQAFEGIRRRVNEISIEFLNLLQSSGFLGSMMEGFEMISGILKTVVVPVFNVFGTVIGGLVSVVSAVLSPALDYLGFVVGLSLKPLELFGALLGHAGKIFEPLINLVGVHLMKAFYAVYDVLADFFGPIIDFVGRAFGGIGDFLNDVFGGIVAGVAQAFQALQPLVDAVSTGFGYLNDWIIQPITDTFNKLKDAVAWVFDSFNSVGDVVSRVKLFFSDLGIKLMEFQLAMKEYTDWLSFGTSDEEEAEQEMMRKAIELKKAENDAVRERLQQNETKNREENEAIREQKELAKIQERAQRDAELANWEKQSKEELASGWKNMTDDMGNRVLNTFTNTSSQIAGAGVKQTKDGIKEQQELNYANAQSTLKTFAAQEGSYLVGNKGQNSINQITQKKQEQENANSATSDDASQQTNTTGQQGRSFGATTTETTSNPNDIMITLNSNVETLVNLTRAQLQAQKTLIGVTGELSGDVFGRV